MSTLLNENKMFVGLAINSVVPSVPTIFSVLDPNVGSLDPYGTSTSSRPMLGGGGVAGDIVTIFDNGVAIGSAVVDPMGSWQLTPAADLTNGHHALAATDTNAAGMISPVSNVFNLTIVALQPLPAAPEITTIIDALGPHQGYIPPTGIATDSHPTVIGTGHPGDTISVYDNTLLLGTTVVGSNGRWQFQPVAAVADGAHNVHATSTNDAGTSSASNTYDFSTTQIMVTGVYSDGVLVSQGGTANGTVTVTGWISDASVASQGLAIYLSGGDKNVVGMLWDNNLSGTMTVTGNTFTATIAQAPNLRLNFPLDGGTYHIDAIATGADGKVMTLSDKNLGWTFTDNFQAVPVLVPAAPEVTTILDAAGPHQGNIPPTGIATDSHPTVMGTGHAGDIISVYDNTSLLGTTVVGANGTWQFKPVAALADGAHNVHATSTNEGGTSGASNAYGFSTTQIMITGVYDGNNTLVPDGGTTQGAITVKGWIADPSLASAYSNLFVMNDKIANWSKIVGPNLTIDGNSFSVVLSSSSFTGVAGAEYLTSGTVSLGVLVSGSMGNIMTMQDSRLTYTIVDDFNGKLPALQATHIDTAAAADDVTALAAHASDASIATQAEQHAVVGEHDTFKGAAGNATVDLSADPAVYFKAASAHIQGGEGGVHTLHLTGDHQVLDLTSLSGKTAAAKVSGIEAVDLGGAHNTLKLSLVDVLNLAEPDLFQKDGKQQMLVNGSNGDAVDLSNAHVAGVDFGHWMEGGTAQVGGVTYNVYEHSGAHAELLVQQGVQIALHG